ncbi:MAG: penicillin-binding protein 2 [Prolixibacteraceae bacterium]|nr:penicillin-binding protein 2 [Prolixibacteraceae bacterium]
MAIFVITGFIFLIKIFRLQVLDPTYKRFATNNVLREVVQYPARGLIYDRNGKLLVFNKAAYDLLITPREVAAFDTIYLCNLLDITKEDLLTGIKAAIKYSRYKPSILVKQIPPESYAILQEQMYKFKGFHTQSRTLREYSNNAAAHILGYVSEVTQRDIKKDPYYRVGDYIGASGIERVYENQLRGKKGVKKYLVDVHNRIQGSYLNGREDIPAQIGKNITSTLDINLQKYAEKLMQNKRGSVVAIEPSTGEILTILSAPAYDPGLLVGRVRGVNYAKLNSDSLKPLFNRAVSAEYPPGSTFKTVNALIGLQEQAITVHTRFSCAGPGSVPIRCTHYHETPLNVVAAIRESCNPFLWNTFRATLQKYKSAAEGYNEWRNYVLSFGVGRKLNSDIYTENKGNLPEESYYNRIYGKGHWNALTIRSLAIGQGEIGVTPLQLANIAAIIANRGYYYIPHTIKDIDGNSVDTRFTTKQHAKVSSEHYEPIITGMELAMGPASSNAKSRIPGISMCGKTGTAQNPHGSAHSIFMAFAPKDEPRIAISVYVENGVWGSRYAAPIASLLIEKYLNDSISRNRKWLESAMLKANLLNPNQPE